MRLLTRPTPASLLISALVLPVAVVGCGKASVDKRLNPPGQPKVLSAEFQGAPPPVALPVPPPVDAGAAPPADAPPPADAASAPAPAPPPAGVPAAPVDLTTMDLDQINDLALKAEQNGEIAKAEQLRLAAVEVAKGVKPWNHLYPDMLRTLGFFYHFRGEAAKAEPVFLELIKVVEEIYGPEDSGVADSIIHLTGVYNAQAKFEFSEPIYSRAIAIRAKTFGPDSQPVEEVMGFHAGCLRNLGRNDEAAKIEEKMKEMQRRRASGQSDAKPKEESKAEE